MPQLLASGRLHPLSRAFGDWRNAKAQYAAVQHRWLRHPNDGALETRLINLMYRLEVLEKRIKEEVQHYGWQDA